MTHDYIRMCTEEMAETSEFLHSLSDEQWNVPSLCAGWQVRDVIGHQCVGHTMKLGSFPVLLVKYKGNIAKGSAEMSVAFGQSHSPTQILEVYDRVRVHPEKAGLGKVIRPHEMFTDHLVHTQDIRRPLGKLRDVPRERLVGAMDALPRIGGFLKSNKLVKGFRFVATDIDHAVGEGPEVRGPGESLVMAMAGRPAGLDSLEGPGLPAFSERVKARN